MSRIGRSPIEVPSGVEVEFAPGMARVKGPKGSLERSLPKAITATAEAGQVVVTRSSDEGPFRALHGLTRTLIANMIAGVTQGFEKDLEIHGVGYRAELKGKDMELQLGFSHSIKYAAPEGIDFNVEVTPAKITRITVKGIDKELVGQVAAEIRAFRPPDPYKQKGVRYAGEHIRKKAGKAAATTT